MGRTAVLLGGGTVAGAAVALGISRYFAPLLYNVSPHDPAAFATAIGVIARDHTAGMPAPRSSSRARRRNGRSAGRVTGGAGHRLCAT